MIRTPVERIRRALTQTRPFRCRECHWRGWLIPVEPLVDPAAVGALAAYTQQDLTALDAFSLTQFDVPPPSSRVTAREGHKAGARPD